ncbi:MAG: hypothetical protein HY235_01820 [Acidobacteria bacterium]|nr:hypothetical protein [Acidobacteriota bacterium]
MSWLTPVLLGLAILATLPYIPALSLPLISDDYLVIALSRHYGPMDGWPDLLRDPLYRNRATSLVLTYWVYLLFGLKPLVYGAVSVLFHIFNTWLVFAFGACKVIGWRMAAVAAAFFAVYEGHQEAVIWFSALPELLVFFFGLCALLAWLRWVCEGSRLWFAAALTGYALALFSKESAVALVPLLLCAYLTPQANRRRVLLGLLPFFLLTGIYAGLVFSGQSGNHHFRDGTFHWNAPFWITLGNSVGRLLWFWGLLSMAALVLWRPSHWKLWAAVAFGWMVITLTPYSFLTYMTRVPSRHTYMASAGLALLVAVAILHFERRRWIGAAIGALLVAHNCGYVWIYKQRQYVARAAPTEALIRVVSQADGPVFVESFPYSRSIAEYTVELMTGKPRTVLLFDERQRPSASEVFSWRE